MFITKKHYKKIVNALYEAAELVLKQQRIIEQQDKELDMLKYNVSIADIDFPNTSTKKGGIEGSDIFTM